MAEPRPWRVSAIVPSYNRAAFLPETIGCLLAQTCPPHEIIVVDDGSTDDTAAAVAAFGDRVRYARIDNSGAPVARNVGAAMATGDWLWFCDSDDLWRPTYLQRCRTVAQTPPHPQFLFGDFQLVRHGVWQPGGKFATAPPGFWERLRRTPAPGGWIIDQPLYGELLAFQPVFHSTLVMTRDAFERVGGYDPQFARTGSEDFEFTLRCVAQAPLGMVDEPLVGIRRHDGNFSRDHLRELLGEVAILRHALRRHPAAAAHEARIQAEIGRRTLAALAVAFSAGDFDRVAELAGALEGYALDGRSRLKVWLSRLPAALRGPVRLLTSLRRPPAAVAP
jgi:glycosyltransferase involved in cell wall biosynthesis